MSGLTSFHYKIAEDDVTVESLLREVWQAGKKTVHLMRMAKSVTTMDGEPIDWRTPLPKGTELTFSVPEARSSYFPEEGELEIRYEDEHLLAVYKEAGIATHPEAPGQGGTLMNKVMMHIEKNGGTYAEHIHRLDKGTAGVLLIAKHPVAKAMLDRMLERHEIRRTYKAEVEGILKRPKGTINLPLGKDRHHAAKRRVSLSGQSAITHFTVIERKTDSTIVEAELETGRTHQIRIHFAHLGHPIVGDTLYGGDETADGEYHLTAINLTFSHPFTHETIIVE